MAGWQDSSQTNTTKGDYEHITGPVTAPTIGVTGGGGAQEYRPPTEAQRFNEAVMQAQASIISRDDFKAANIISATVPGSSMFFTPEAVLAELERRLAHPGMDRKTFMGKLGRYVPLAVQAAFTAMGAGWLTAVSRLGAKSMGHGTQAAPVEPSGEVATSWAPPSPQSNGGFMFDGFDWGGLMNTGTSLLNNIISAKMQQRAAPPAVLAAAPAVAAPMQVAGMFPAIGRVLGGGAGLIGGAVAAGAGILRTAAGRIRGVVLSSGKFISSKKGVALAKRVGIDAAAAALGITAVEMAQMYLDAGTGTRRSRGVSAANIRTTRRTIRAVTGLHRQIVSACSSGTGLARRSSSGSSGRRVVFAKACK